MSQGLALAILIILTVIIGGIGILKWIIEKENATYLGIGSAFFLGVMTLFIVGAVVQWPGGADGCLGETPDTCYCENSSTAELTNPGSIKQPVNTLSAIAPVIAGLLIMGMIDNDHKRGVRRSNTPNLLTGRTTFSLVFGLAVIFLGPGSMFFHASMGQFYSSLDPLSMTLFITFIILYDIFVLTGIADPRILRGRILATSFDHFLGIWLILNFVFFILMVTMGIGSILFGITVFLAVVGQICILLIKTHINREYDWLLVALLTFMLAVFIWHWSQTGNPLCVPTDPMQGHALWHVLAMAMAPFFIFKYLRTEKWENNDSR